MERKIGDTFEFEGKKLQVKESEEGSCNFCFFNEECKNRNLHVSGACDGAWRDDEKNVIFVEVQEQPQEEQPQEEPQEQAEQPQKLNLCEVLRYCPVGEPFWSPMLGDVKLHHVRQEAERLSVITKYGATWDVNADGTLTITGDTSPEIMLYPSRKQRDWAKVKYEKKKELPRTWEEFCKNYLTKKTECFIGNICNLREVKEVVERHEDCNRNLLPSKQAAEAHLALMQLHQLRDAWREGWLPDWKDLNSMKYCIERNRDEYKIEIHRTSQRFLAFKGYEQAKEFINCFIGFLMKAGDLI